MENKEQNIEMFKKYNIPTFLFKMNKKQEETVKQNKTNDFDMLLFIDSFYN